MTEHEREHDVVVRLAKVAYAAYQRAREHDLGAERLVSWAALSPEAVAGWEAAVQATEGLHDPPLAADAGWPRLEEL